MRQQSFELKTWGGKRKGAGRKPAPGRDGIRHDPRDSFRASQPVHVTLRTAEHVWNLRSERSFRIVDGALRAVRARADFRVVHFSVQGNHVHLIVEARGVSALASGMRALCIRLARRLNAMMGRSGPAFAARYHAHVLRTPGEIRNAVRYVLGNFASHAARRGERVPARHVDRFSSASGRGALHAQGSLFEEPATSEARTWGLRVNGGRSEDARAECVIRGGQFVVRKGSTARSTEAPSLPETYRDLRVELRKEGVLVPGDEGLLRFAIDYAFDSPSGAASVVTGTSINGRMAWKVKGQELTYREWQERQVSAQDAAAPPSNAASVE